MEETIELRELLEIVNKRKWIIIVVTAIAVTIGGIYSAFFITPLYKSETTLMVNNSKGLSSSDLAASFDLGSISTSQKLVITYGEIVKSRIVLEQVIEKQGLEDTYEQLLKRITSEPVKSTEILKISVTDIEPAKAASISNSIADVFIKEVMRILKVNNVETIDRAIAIDKPINVKTKLNIAISLVLGLMLGVFIAFALEYLDNTIKTPQDVEKALGLAIIGTIPEFSHIESPKGGAKNDRRSSRI